MSDLERSSSDTDYLSIEQWGRKLGLNCSTLYRICKNLPADAYERRNGRRYYSADVICKAIEASDSPVALAAISSKVSNSTLTTTQKIYDKCSIPISLVRAIARRYNLFNYGSNRCFLFDENEFYTAYRIYLNEFGPRHKQTTISAAIDPQILDKINILMRRHGCKSKSHIINMALFFLEENSYISRRDLVSKLYKDKSNEPIGQQPPND